MKTLGYVMRTVNYLLVIDCEHHQENRNESHRKDHRSGKRGFMKPKYVPSNRYKFPKMTNSISTDVIFAGKWCNRAEAKQEDCHYATSADKQINE